MGRKYARILSSKLTVFPRATLSENCSLFGTDNRELEFTKPRRGRQGQRRQKNEFIFESHDTLKSLTLFITFKTITKLNPEHSDQFEKKKRKLSVVVHVLQTTQDLVISRRCRCCCRRGFVNSLMSADKYPSIFSRQMEAIVYVFSRQMEAIREFKLDVYGKRQTAKMKLLPSVFSSLYSRIKIFVFAVNSKRHFSIFV